MSTCPACGAARAPDAAFCEQCGFDLAGSAAPVPASAVVTEAQSGTAPSQSPTVAGQESPLDVGWTGPVARPEALVADDGPQTCPSCQTGSFEDGYCNHCGAKRPDPRDHFVETPAPWVAGVCDIGRRHPRNEDALALHASQAQLAFAALVVCDGVSNSANSHVASLAAARAARDILDDPLPRGMGLHDAVIGSIEAQLGHAVRSARDAVVQATPDVTAANPPSCTLVAALVDEGTAVIGNVGDSRAYWLPDAASSAPRQLSTDDSFAAERILDGVPREQAETGPQAHAITRWLGVDAPVDLVPHTSHVELDEDGWLLLCSDGLWNYCSDAVEVRALVASTVASLGDTGLDPLTLAQALTDHANERGGADNITVALARVGPLPADAGARAPEAADPAPPPTGLTETTTVPTSMGEDSADGTVHH